MNKKTLYTIIVLLSFALIGSVVINYNLRKQADQMVIDNAMYSDASGNVSNIGKDASLNKDKAGENNALGSESIKIYVDVGGAVKNPGVYTFKQGDRVIDAINEAGGLRDNADVSSINLAKKLADEEKIYVPIKGEQLPQIIAQSGLGNNNGSTENDKININTASLQELDSLPGIGPVTAQRIIDYRNKNGPFKSIDEIKNVNRIGDKIFEQIKDKITI